MTTNTTTTDTCTGKELRGFAEFTNYKLAEALHCSEGHIKTYQEQHVVKSRALDEKRSTLLAIARLQSVLQQTRPSLDGMFTEENFVALLNCFQGDIFYPGQIRRIASDLCDDAGVDVDCYETSGIAPLVDKHPLVGVFKRCGNPRVNFSVRRLAEFGVLGLRRRSPRFVRYGWVGEELIARNFPLDVVIVAVRGLAFGERPEQCAQGQGAVRDCIFLNGNPEGEASLAILVSDRRESLAQPSRPREQIQHRNGFLSCHFALLSCFVSGALGKSGAAAPLILPEFARRMAPRRKERILNLSGNDGQESADAFLVERSRVAGKYRKANVVPKPRQPEYRCHGLCS